MNLKVFDMGDDCEWWMGNATPDQMKAAYCEEYGYPEFADWEVTQLSDEAMEKMNFYYDENDSSLFRSFREELALQDHSDPTPRFFAGIEQ